MEKKVYFLVLLVAVVIGYSVYRYSVPVLKATKYKLPQPTGLYSVGTTTWHLIDMNRREHHSSSQNFFRELMVQVWYPALNTANKQKSFYAEPAVIAAQKEWLSKEIQISSKEISHLSSLKSHARVNAPVALQSAKYPVLIFSPGWGGPVTIYTALVEELASHGYIVLGINYPYVSNPVVFPDGRIINPMKQPEDSIERLKIRTNEYQTWMQDIKFVVDQLVESCNDDDIHQAIDLNCIGVLGHSFGGSVSLGVCQSDNRIKAGVDLDGKIQLWNEEHILTVPFLFIVAQHSEKTLQSIEKLVNGTIPRPELVKLSTADHGSFTDLYLLTPWKTLPELNPIESIKITRALLVKFFGKHLKEEK